MELEASIVVSTLFCHWLFLVILQYMWITQRYNRNFDMFPLCTVIYFLCYLSVKIYIYNIESLIFRQIYNLNCYENYFEVIFVLKITGLCNKVCQSARKLHELKIYACEQYICIIDVL